MRLSQGRGEEAAPLRRVHRDPISAGKVPPSMCFFLRFRVYAPRNVDAPPRSRMRRMVLSILFASPPVSCFGFAFMRHAMKTALCGATCGALSLLFFLLLRVCFAARSVEWALFAGGLS